MNVKRLYPQLLLLCPPLADHKYKRSLKNPHSRLCCQDQTMWSIMYINAWKWWAWLHSHLARNLPGSSMCNSLQSFQAMGTTMSWTQCAWRCNRSQLSFFNLILVISSLWSTYSSWLSVLQVLTFIILTFSLSWDHPCCTHLTEWGHWSIPWYPAGSFHQDLLFLPIYLLFLKHCGWHLIQDLSVRFASSDLII
jgi:hypothetical protein